VTSVEHDGAVAWRKSQSRAIVQLPRLREIVISTRDFPSACGRENGVERPAVSRISPSLFRRLKRMLAAERRQSKAHGVSRGSKRKMNKPRRGVRCRPGIIPFCAALLLALAIASAGCKHASTAEPAFFPNEVAGWVKTSATRTFAAADLWRYIDGGAEKYLKAGVQSASTSDYKFQNRLEAVADIYSMSNAEGAREIFDSEPIGDAKTPPLGDSARLHTQSLVFRKGPRLVQIVAYQDYPEAPQALLDLGRGIENRLPR